MKQLSRVEHHHPRVPKKALSRMPNQGLKTRRGFILLSWTLLLIVLPLLLLTGLERRWQLALQAQQQQRRYLQALTQSLSALTLRPTWCGSLPPLSGNASAWSSANSV